MKTPYLILGALMLMASCAAASAEVVVVVSAKSPIADLSANEIADIFLGKRSRFPDGSNAIPIDQAEGSPEREAFYARFAAKTPVEMKMHWSKLIFTGRGQPPRQVHDAAAVKAALAQQPNAIGYLDRRYVDASLTILE
ncbi:MAG: phosphate ABC transporter substrate-binding protein [Pseudomonadota bacterium]|nr:phosphate ABC transporter substrate-binding protein [Pseudomonadota bacterium]